MLTESFNSMTRQLGGGATRASSRAALALEAAKAHLENILANLSAGVLVFDHELQLSISNHGAQPILGAELEAFAGAHARAVRCARRGELAARAGAEGHGKTLHARGARLPQATGGGYVVVFDDVTQLIQAQRATAWAEVARRLAHEIKNPLTPIQLSAERLEMKLAERLSPRGCRSAAARHRDHRQPGGGAEGHGGRLQGLCAPAGARAGAARPERPGARRARAVRELERADRHAARAERCRRSGPTPRRSAR